MKTTGFFTESLVLSYLSAVCTIQEMNFVYTQWLAENFNDEANVLMAFNKFIKDFDTVIHLMVTVLYIPFLTERGKKYNLEFDLIITKVLIFTNRFKA